MDDLPLFAHARHDDPDTSHAAADKITKVTGKHARAVLSYAQQRGGDPWTDEHLCAANADKSESSMRSRRAQLVERGMIESCGETTNSRGNRTQLWRVTSKGRAVQ